MTVFDWLLLAVALAGHLALWVLANNYVHALPIRYQVLKLYSRGLHVVMVSLPPAGLWLAWRHPAAVAAYSNWSGLWPPLQVYLLFCWAMALGPLTWWAWLRWRQREPEHLIEQQGQRTDLCTVLGHRPLARGGLRARLACLPGNDLFTLEENQKTILLPRLPAELDGLAVAHISDLHLEGTVGPAFFREVINRVNRLEADVIAVTGDVFDRAACLDWIPETLAQLQAPLGVYFILGNHDLRLGDVERVRRALREIGWRNLGGRWELVEWRGHEVLLAGNELPWIKPAANLDDAPQRNGQGTPLRVLLAHTPDQYPWARKRDFDLMLAGHCHGGQIRLPFIGPVVSPSRRGARYASGTFYESPTLLHVSRGVSSMQTVRYNCPPEITRLVLRSPVARETEATATTQMVEEISLVSTP